MELLSVVESDVTGRNRLLFAKTTVEMCCIYEVVVLLDDVYRVD